jgi:hypothetical protein
VVFLSNLYQLPDPAPPKFFTSRFLPKSSGKFNHTNGKADQHAGTP